jgi:hypothetical protein
MSGFAVFCFRRTRRRARRGDPCWRLYWLKIIGWGVFRSVEVVEVIDDYNVGGGVTCVIYLPKHWPLRLFKQLEITHSCLAIRMSRPGFVCPLSSAAFEVEAVSLVWRCSGLVIGTNPAVSWRCQTSRLHQFSQPACKLRCHSRLVRSIQFQPGWRRRWR